MKKGQAQQFNWIFVIIAGSILLAFFMFFTFKYVELQEKRAATDTAQTIQESLEILKAGELYLDDSQFRLGQITNVETACINEKQYIYINNFAESQIENAIVFTPAKQTTASFNAWTNAYEEPFFITNIIYILNPQETIEIVYDHTTREQVEQLNIPEIFNTKKTTTATTENPIYITQQVQGKRHINLNTNEVTINNNKIQTDNQALALGILFTEDEETFKCNIARAKAKQQITKQTYVLKASLLKTKNPLCPYERVQKAITENENAEEENKQLIDNNCPMVF